MMPIGDWQFLAVSLVAIAALAVIVRRIVPRRRRDGSKASPACDHCATNPGAETAAPRRTTTVPFVSVDDLREGSRARRR
jgi:hypothetical protein